MNGTVEKKSWMTAKRGAILGCYVLIVAAALWFSFGPKDEPTASSVQSVKIPAN